MGCVPKITSSTRNTLLPRFFFTCQEHAPTNLRVGFTHRDYTRTFCISLETLFIYVNTTHFRMHQRNQEWEA